MSDGLDSPERKTPIKKLPGFTMTERGPVILGPTDGPLEAPVKELQSGPLYMGVEEVLPDVDALVTEQTELVKQERFSSASRRDFLKLFSAGAVASSAACVRRPLEKAIPYVNQPVDQAVGVATHYASTCGECPAGCGVVVRAVSGLAVKIEGSIEHPISQGGTCTLGQASIQRLFHPERRKSPVTMRGNLREEGTWDDAYELLAGRLQGKKVAIFTGGSTGNQRNFYADVLKRFGGSADDLYTYEPNSLYSSLSEAHRLAYGVDGFPRVDFRQARVVAGIGSDFLDVGTSMVFHAKGFSHFHSLREGKLGKFIQFESQLTQTGSKSDDRYVIAPGSEIVVALLLVKALLAHEKSKGSTVVRAEIESVLKAQAPLLNGAYDALGIGIEVFQAVAAELLEAPSVVVAGSSLTDSNAVALQLAAIFANELLGAYGKTIFLDRGWMKEPVRVGDVERFLKNAGNYDAVFFIETNPVFTLPPALKFADTVKKIPLVVSAQSYPNEMDHAAHFILPCHHYLESWGDEEPVAGFWTARQPVIRATADSRQAEDMFLWLLAHLKKPMPYREYRDYLREKWRTVQSWVDAKVEFNIFFDSVLRRGFVGKLATRAVPAMRSVSGKLTVMSPLGAPSLKLLAPLDPRLRDGRGAMLPVLQEIGDGISTIAWDSWLAINPNTAKKLGLRRNDLVIVETEHGKVEVAVFPQPGMHADTLVIHRGNGHGSECGTIERNNGVNPMVLFGGALVNDLGLPTTAGVDVKITGTGKIYQLAAMQKSHDLGNRTDIVRKMSASAAASSGPRKKSLDEVPDLYPTLDKDVPYRWGMAVDLTKCSGCGACMSACAIENNVPQVGRGQILLGREMHWVRLDRYYSGDLENPQVSFQPMMCQQCTHAPCEAVCPVIATSHDPEGINAMTYNRCIGTRYCANACPYKVRRFNWWTHKWGVMGERPMDRMPRALNPDVVVRTRGVMEKCNFCIQRVRDAKLRAKDRGSSVMDGEIRVACEQVCPSDAITFGNLKDSASRVNQLRQDPRAYLALGGNPDHNEYGLKTLPNVNYLAQLTHKDAGAKEHHE